MIYCKLRSPHSINSHPDLLRGVPPAGLLSAEEAARFAELAVDKRRHDWLLGRWTAKNLLQTVVGWQVGAPPPLDELPIANDPDGVPFAPGYPGYSLSISHSHEMAFCAVVERAAWPIGADIERIEARVPVFVDDYFTGDEKAWMDAFPQFHKLLVTAIWSAKEAALKALRLGLSVDTRAVTCLMNPAVCSGGWMPFDVHLDAQRLPGARPSLTGWWMVIPGYTLTVVTQADDRLRPLPLL